MNPEYSIAVKPPGAAAFEQLGSGMFSSVKPENIVHTHELPGGPGQLSFSLKRDTRLLLPDEKAFSEVHCRLAGMPVWSGRLMRTPRSRGNEYVINPIAEGWWGSLADYPIDEEYVTQDLSRFVPMATARNDTILTEFNGAHNPTYTDGTVIIPISQGSVIRQSSGNGVCLDAGPNNTWKYGACKLQIQNTVGTTSFIVYIVASNKPMNIASGTGCSWSVISSIANPASGSVYDFGGVAATDYRYLNIYYLYSGVTTTCGADHSIRISTVIAAKSNTYVSYPNSVLKASTVMIDALSNAPKVSTDTSNIEATTFNIPEYGTNGRRSISDVILDVNNYHQYQAYLGTQIVPLPYFRPVPTSPTWLVKESDAYKFDDAGANDGSEVVNTCIMQYEDAAGTKSEYIATATGTVFDTLGYDRAVVLQARSKMTAAAAQQIAEAYVNAHQTSPFKGKVVISGSITRFADGMRIPVGLITVGDAVCLSSELGDSGRPGRIGIIQKVTYSHDRLEAELELDSSRNYINAILDRLAIVTR